MTFATSFASKLVSCNFTSYGPAITFRFEHPYGFEGIELLSYVGDLDVPKNVFTRLCKAIVAASGHGYLAQISNDQVIVYRDEINCFIGLLFYSTGKEIDFRNYWTCE